MRKIKEIKSKNLTWVILTNPRKKEINYLKKRFHFLNELDLKDCLPPLQRAKLVAHPEYLFMIFQFPFYERSKKEIKASEIDIFVNENTLILVHEDRLPPLKEFIDLCSKDEKIRAKYLIGNPGILIYEILNRLLNYCFPMLNHISLDINDLENQIFNGRYEETVIDVLSIRRNIINFRRAMQAHKGVIEKLLQKAPQFFSVAQINIYFHNLIAHLKEIWDDLETYKESIEALYNTNESLVSLRLNEIMKTLTVFSVIVFPLTLVAGIFGMNTVVTPLVNNPHGFWYIILIMSSMTIVMAIFFKMKRWI